MGPITRFARLQGLTSKCHLSSSFSYLVNLVTPRVGEVARCTALNRTDEVPFDKLFGTVVLERVVDTLMFGLVVLVTLFTQAQQLGIFLEQSGADIPELSFGLIAGLSQVLVLLAVVLSTRKIWSQWSFVQKISGFLWGIVEGSRAFKGGEQTVVLAVFSHLGLLCRHHCRRFPNC